MTASAEPRCDDVHGALTRGGWELQSSPHSSPGPCEAAEVSCGLVSIPLAFSLELVPDEPLCVRTLVPLLGQLA